MTTTVTHQCDVCGESWTAGSKTHQLWRVEVRVKGPHQSASFMLRRDAELCRPCAVKLGLVNSSAQSDPPKPELEPTIEELLRQIVQDEIEACAE